jgi:glycerate 2-kinase
MQLKKALEKFFPNAVFVKVPMADGGEGIVDSLVNSLDGHMIKQKVTGPLGEKADGFFGLIHNGKTAVIEMAAASKFAFSSAKR